MNSGDLSRQDNIVLKDKREKFRCCYAAAELFYNQSCILLHDVDKERK